MFPMFPPRRVSSSRGYLDRFSYIYLDGGLIPDQVFQLREKKTGLCLQLRFSMGCHQQHWGFMQETLANSGIYATAIGKKNDLCNINADGTNENGDSSNEHDDTSNTNVALMKIGLLPTKI